MAVNQIIVAGMGRCGTSLVLNAIQKATDTGHRWVTHLESAPRLSRKIIKTHDFAPQRRLPSHIKFVYLFGNPMQIVCSCESKGPDFINKHYPHMNANPTDHPQVFSKDTMRLGDNVRSWFGASGIDILYLRYETLWDHNSEISDFLGFTVTLPPYRARKSNWLDHPQSGALQDTYGELNQYLLSAPDSFRKNGGDPSFLAGLKYYLLMR